MKKRNEKSEMQKDQKRPGHQGIPMNQLTHFMRFLTQDPHASMTEKTKAELHSNSTSKTGTNEIYNIMFSLSEERGERLVIR